MLRCHLMRKKLIEFESISKNPMAGELIYGGDLFNLVLNITALGLIK